MFWKQSLILFVATVAFVNAEVTEEETRRAIRMKTTRQLKSMFEEVDAVFDASLDKDGLQEFAFQSNLMERYWKLHPSKRPKPKVKDPPAGDFAHIQDPVKRRALESLKRKGINIGMAGGAAMSLDALIDMDRQTSGLPPLEKNDYDQDL